MNDAKKTDNPPMVPFADEGEALKWLDLLVRDGVRFWRVEVHYELYRAPVPYTIRAYPMHGGGGWHNGAGTTIVEAIGWLRHGIENTP